MVARAAEAEAEHVARMAMAWALLWMSDEPMDHALALCWLGRHMDEMFWRFDIAMQVDALGAQLKPEAGCTGLKQG